TMNLQNIHGKLNRLLAGGDLEAEYKPSPRLRFYAHVSSFSNRFWYGNVPYNNNDPRNGYFTAEFSLKHPGYYKDASIINTGGSPYLGKLLDLDDSTGHGDNYRNIQPQYSYAVAPDSFEFKRLFTEINNTFERNPIVAQLDGSYAITDRIKISAGAKFYWKYGERNISYHEWQFDKSTQTGAQQYLMTNLNLEPVNPNGGYLPEYGDPYSKILMPFLTRPQLTAMVSQFANRWFEYTMNEENVEYWLWVGSSYKYHEYTSSGYIMADATLFGCLNLTGGLRIENNSMYVTGDTLDTQPTIDYTTGYVYYKKQSRTIKNNTLAFLPSLNLTWNIKDNQNLRFAVSRTYHRQNFSEVKPGAAVINYSDFEFTFGNPNLKPTYSVNLDIAYEYFWGNKGMFEIGSYYKYITDHIFATTQADADPTTGIIYKSFQNAGKSWVWGVEAMFKRRFDFLPKFLSGFGVDANITYSLSRMQVPGRYKQQPLAEQTPLLYNVALFYEKYGVSARVALNYTGPFLKALNLAAVTGIGLVHKDDSYDVFMSENYSLDAQVAYSFKKHFMVYIELNNLVDSPYKEYRGDPNRPVRVEYYRQRGQIGFKYTLD
ncbi:MAG TPA: TonB-dependent receptor, partial [Chitinophagales bacterium]|nr:TonB-dependent receptor [Chitinophagales bacterium]